MRSRLLGSSLAVAALVGGALGPAAGDLHAQYFGRNKVQYESFDFEVLKTPHFDVYFYPAEREGAEHAARMAERWYARLSRLFEHELRGRQPLILYSSQPDFQQTNAVLGELGEATGGVTEVLKRRIVLPLAGPLAESDHVLGHELVHAFQFDLTGEGGGRIRSGVPGALRLPLWFIEGMAEYLSVGPVDPHTAMWMRDATREKKLPTIPELSSPRYFPYRYGQALWAYVAGRWGETAVARMLKAAGRTGDVERAFGEVLGVSSDSLSRDWHEAIRAAYEPVLEVTRAPEAYARPVLNGKKDEGRLEIAPALSPDGKWIVFLSERGLFSIDMFLADVETGKIERKIVETALDPHFQSLEFIRSAGAWDPEGRRFAFAAVRKARPVLSVLDVRSRRIEREIHFPDLGEIFNPSWSPDGRRIVFSALAGGLTDLFVYDLERDTLIRLTNDPFADLQPAWSPDGRRIAFVTDRFSSRIGDLKIGEYRLAWIDPRSREIEALPGFEDAKNINPQWSPDGGTLYFLSDRNGITNIYRLELASGRILQVTNLQTGVSGITPLSPALTTALGTGRVAFSVYERERYRIYLTDSPEVLAGGPLAGPSHASAAALPPSERADRQWLALAADPGLGVPADTALRVTDYGAGLSLDYIAQPQLAVGFDRFGTFVGGGTALYWSDMLGNRNLVTLLQVGGELEDLAALAGYVNRTHRWNWGVIGQQVPFLTGAVSSSIQTVRGERALVEQVFRFRQINRQISGLVQYPFSEIQRLELSAGFQSVSFDREVETRAISLETGRVLIDTEDELAAPDAINFGLGSAALVYDNSLFGATSPILGQRYRVEVSPLAGDLTFYNLLFDYRRYVMPVRRLTLAGRVLHFGRYGGDADDPRLFPLFLGYQNLVRGYGLGSFSADECPEGGDECPVFDQLLGSRLAVANVELRFPLLGVLGVGSGYYGAFPLEAALFADAGVAWTRDDDPSLFGGERDAVASAGVALRFNVFGYFIAELDYVRPFDRPDKGWHFQFGLTPGF